jgi:hypothetical protein
VSATDWKRLGPAAGQVDTDATSRLTDPCTNFEQLRAQSFVVGVLLSALQLLRNGCSGFVGIGALVA